LALAHINIALEFGQPDTLETYSSSKHLFVDLNIPEGTKGRIAESKGRVSGLSGDEKSTRASSSRDGKHAGGHSRDGKSGPGHQRGDRNRQRRRTRGGSGSSQG
jgi:hypothetical protein